MKTLTQAWKVKPMYDRLAAFILAHRKLVIALTLTLGLVCLSTVPRLEFNFTPQQLFASKKRNFDTLREEVASRYGREDNLIMLLINAPDIWQPEVLTYTHQLTLRLKQWPELKHADGLTTIELPRADGDSLTTRPLVFEALESRGIDPTSPQAAIDADTAQRLKAAVAGEPLVEGRLISKKGDAMAVVMWVRDDIEQAADLIRLDHKLVQTLANAPPPPGVTVEVGGIPRVRVDVVSNLKREQMTFLPLVGFAYIILLALMFRRPAGVILPMAIVALAACFTVAWMVTQGMAINIINNTLPLLIFVIGVSDSIHMLTRQAEEIDRGLSHEQAIAEMVKQTGLACFLTSATTAVGFISLLVADTEILQRYGMQAAFGVMAAYVVTLIFLPAALTYMRPVARLESAKASETINPLDPASIQHAPRLERGLVAFGHMVTARPSVWLTGALLLLGGAGLWGTNVKIDTTLLEIYTPDHPTVKTTKRLEDALGGLLPVEINISHPDRDHFKDPAAFANIQKLQAFAASQPGALSSQSMVDFHQAARVALLGDPAQRTVMPESREQIEQLQLLIEGPPDQTGGVRAFVTSDFQHTRVLIRVADIGAKKMIVMGQALDQELARLFPPAQGYTTAVAGDAYVASLALDSFIKDLFGSLISAVGLIFLMMTLFFRSLRAGLVSVLPNITPLIATFGYMGWAGIDLNTTTVIIFAISLGLAVDNTIHFLARFSEERPRYAHVRQAVIATYFGAGRAIMLSSTMLALGISILIFSDFIPSQLFGKLMSLTIVSAIIGDMIILPAIILLAYRDTTRVAHHA
jgi:hydrophobe/amphiphile efflux-3 (HAE3) family protein